MDWKTVLREAKARDEAFLGLALIVILFVFSAAWVMTP